jgi:AAA domain
VPYQVLRSPVAGTVRVAEFVLLEDRILAPWRSLTRQPPKENPLTFGGKLPEGTYDLWAWNWTHCASISHPWDGGALNRHPVGVKVALSGAHGVGKSTMAASLAQELRLPVLPTPGRWMAARDLPVNQDATVASQMLAWLLQESFEASHDAWIAPRSAVDIWAYAASAAERTPDRLGGYTLDVLSALAEATMKERYTALLYVPPRIQLHPDDVRPGDDRFRDEIDALIRGRLEAWNVPHLVLDVTAPDRRGAALHYIRERYANVAAGADAT